MDELDERFLVISGDVLTDIDLGARSGVPRAGGAGHHRSGPVENPLEFGIVITRDDGSIERFLEKPTWGQVFSDTINTGIFVLEPEIFDYIAADRSVDFSGEVFPVCSRTGEAPVRRGASTATGRTSAPSRVRPGSQGRDRRKGAASMFPGLRWVRAYGWVREQTSTPTRSGRRFAIVGDNCRVEAGALGEYTVLGRNVRVRSDVDIERSVVHDNTYMARACASAVR
jgi:mannose-1-phosphate guanylyltransferase/phosphomannomutase